MQLHGEIVGNLSTYRNDDSVGRFEIDDIKYAFERKLVEVKSVAHVVVGRYRFRVIIDHNRFITNLRAVCMALTEHQSNSTELPMR